MKKKKQPLSPTENIKPLIISIQRPSTSRIKPPKKIIKQDHTNKNNDGLTKTFNRSNNVENMDFETDNISVSLNLADIYKLHLWNKIIYKAFTCEAKLFH